MLLGKSTTARRQSSRFAIALAALALLWSTAADANKRLAKREFDRGKAAFSVGKYRRALEHYKRAYQLVPLPGLLFNIAQCHRNLKEYRQAANFFRLYLTKMPNAPNRSAVETLLRKLEKKAQSVPVSAPDSGPVETPDASPAEPAGDTGDEAQDAGTEGQVSLPPPPPPPPPRSTPFYKRWWFWTAVALAVGGGVAGTYFAARGGSDLPETRFPVFDVSLK